MVHHKSRLESRYEEFLGIEIDNYAEFSTSEELFYRDDDEDIDVEEYLREK